MTSDGEDLARGREEYQARRRARARRTQARLWIGLAGFWVVMAILWWFVFDASPWVRWIYTGGAAFLIVGAVLQVRTARRENGEVMRS